MSSSEKTLLHQTSKDFGLLKPIVPYAIYLMLLIPLYMGSMISLMAYDKYIVTYFPETFGGGSRTTTLIWGVSTALFPFGGWIGTFAATFVDKYLYRKRTTLLFIAVGILGSIFSICSYFTGSFALLALSRFFHGVGSGATMNIGLIYFFEILKPSRHAIVGAIIQPIINLGILLSALFSLETICDTNWNLAGIVLLVMIVLCFFGTLILPESPYHTYLVYGDESKTLEIISLLRHCSFEEAESEFDVIRRKKEESSGTSSMSLKEFLRTKEIRGAIIVTTLIAVFQQMSGINIVIFYCSNFIKQTGFSAMDIGNLILFGVCFVGSVVFCFILPMSQSKIMLVSGFSCMSVSFIVAFTTTMLSMNPLVNVIFLSLFLFWFQAGPGPKMWNIFNETYPDQYKAPAQGFLTFTNWFANFFMTACVPFVLDAIDIYSVLLFAIVNASFAGILGYFMVNNMNKSKEQIIDDYQTKFHFKSK